MVSKGKVNLFKNEKQIKNSWLFLKVGKHRNYFFKKKESGDDFFMLTTIYLMFKKSFKVMAYFPVLSSENLLFYLSDLELQSK